MACELAEWKEMYEEKVWQVLLLAFAEDLECIPGFQQKVFHIEQPSEFIEDQPILNLVFDDCEGNDKLNFEVSNPDFKVEPNGSLVALKNITEVDRALFIHARSAQAEDMAEVLIVGGKEKHGSLKEIFKIEGNLGILRQKRALVASAILIPENQRPPFPRVVGRVINSDGAEGSKFRLSGKGVDQEPKGAFKINENNGEVLVTRSLDREAIPSYQLQVEVTDVSGKSIEGPVLLDVIVIDQNDNRPIFREGPYVGHIMEGSPTAGKVPSIPE
ncbi:cadherin-13 isoform X8 [Emydura macquarii macquarii]|uniref:cadherin-13 isoform X8 n=1 Tax=Emydura macquarii macquarii TaxID=1129001 RepID=UPI00352B444F